MYEELAIAIGDFAASIGELAESDLSRPLQLALKHLSAVQKQAQDLSHTQAQEDTMTFMATAEEYSRIINSVRVCDGSKARLLYLNADSSYPSSWRLRLVCDVIEYGRTLKVKPDAQNKHMKRPKRKVAHPTVAPRPWRKQPT